MNENNENGLNRFLFQSACPTQVERFRMLLAVFLAYVYWPRGLSAVGVPNILLPYQDLFTSSPWRLAIFAGIFLFGLGWQPRLVGAVLVCLLVPHCFFESGRQSRPIIVFVTLCASLMPGAPVWRRGGDKNRDVPPGPIWPIRLIQCQLSVLYGVNALFKTTPEYLSGDVIVALSTQSNSLVDLTGGALALGPFAIPASVLAIGTVATEYWLAIGLWFPRCRLVTVGMGLAFHVSLLFVINIFMLGCVSLFLYLAFLFPFESSFRPDDKRPIT